MSPSPSEVTSKYLVTGASGFLGSWIVHQLLEAGHFVRGTARGAKVDGLKHAFQQYHRFEVATISDISQDDITGTLKDIEFIIHTAAPLPGRADLDTALKVTVNGSLNVLKHAAAANIQNIVVTGSIGSFPTSGPFNPGTFNNITLDGARAAKSDPWLTYFVSKANAEKAILRFSQMYPYLNITIISPGHLFGPFAPGFEKLLVTQPDYGNMSTNGYIAAMMDANNTLWPPSAGIVDVRDAARAHINALSAPPAPRKRFLLVTPENCSWRDAIDFIYEERPHLRDRLCNSNSAPKHRSLATVADHKRVENALSMSLDSYITWKQTVLDSVDAITAIEEVWASKGFVFSVPTNGPTAML
ncbi:NAD(P)-binding protein [Dendrothele bispora CBS 962.96]|uniref:NAD(P)-binding protein n=1 Tax=Dendrothele bispora (strain CBS 962.96) TaxID=1314807 RepID=A0A4S8LBJ9_DENBC|nr:NAD(P)-binding protein [Dendrothele bispora CBS 962.96]